ncbi:MAG: DNA-directed RNA polymerase subunit L [Candidatus Methanoplasma sp.]|jgi:DNA-directed RNA polymerase subunit L|nr:DNA-directed RNA polymerase subunit L [Candidatus Methanoplasma sp.]
METYTVEKTDKTITLGFKNASSALITPIIDALNGDESVTLVRYIDQHPELMDVMMYVEVIKGKPEDALNRASKAVSSYFSSVKQ